MRRKMRAGRQAQLAPRIGIPQIGAFQINLCTDAVAVNEINRATYGFQPDVALTFPMVKAGSPGDRVEATRSGGSPAIAEGRP